MSYHRILRHKITTVHIVTRCLISTLKSTTSSDYRQRIRIGQVLTITRIVNGSHSWPNSPQRQSGRRKLGRDIEHIIFHTYGEDENWLASPHLPHTHNLNIPGEERTFITTGRVTFTCLALLVQSGRSIWNQSAAALYQIRNRQLNCSSALLYLYNGPDSYRNSRHQGEKLPSTARILVGFSI